MSKFNNSILIQNIKLQMKKHSESQKQLADAIGMSQPNFNKAINDKDGKLFTLNQLYDISQHYGVTIDALLGNKPIQDLSPAVICEFIKQLIEHSIVDIQETEYQDNSYEYYQDYAGKEFSSQVPIKNTYLALVFPEYKFEEKYLADWQAASIKLDYAKNGNTHFDNLNINAFIRKYLRLYRLYQKNEIDRDVLDLACEHYIQEVIDDGLPFF